MSIVLKLSTKYFVEASKFKGNDEFCFIVNGKDVRCHKFAAALLSPKVAQMLIDDPTLDYFIINADITKVTKKLNNSDQNQACYDQIILTFLQKLVQGEQIEITESNVQEMVQELEDVSQSTDPNYANCKIYYYLLLIESLGNEELKQQFYSSLFLYLNQDTNSQQSQKASPREIIEKKIKKINSIEKIVSIHNLIQNSNNDENIPILIKDYLGQEYISLIKEIATNFNEIEESLFFTLNSSIFEDVLQSSDLTIKDEDSLLNLLLNRRRYILENGLSNDDFFLHCIEYENLSEEGIQNFLNEVGFDSINEIIWERIKKRLILPVENKEKGNHKYSLSKGYFFNGSNNFGGIISHLTQVTNGNVFQNKTIDITCSKLCCGDIKSLVDFNSAGGWVHVYASPSPRWIQYDFKSREIQINAYQLKSSGRGSDDYLKSWRMEISDDGSKWDKIDEQNNVTELNGQDLTKLFNVQMTKPFRFIRIATETPAFSGNNYFSIGKLEFYGKIIGE